MARSPFATTIAGSLPKPAWLAEPEKLWGAWQHEGEALRRAQEDAVLVWLKLQEDAGIDIVSDGEQFRIHFVHGFLEHVSGIDWQKKTRMGIRDNRYVVEVPTVTGPITRKRSVHSEDVRFVRANTKRKMKFTLPGPMTICDTIADAHYGRRADMAMAFAKVLNAEARELEALGADVIQFDEPCFNVYVDKVKDWGMAALERAAQGVTATKAIHICYGYGTAEVLRWKTSNTDWSHYEATLPLLAKSTIDQVSVETAASGVDIAVIEALRGKDVLLGVVDVGTDEVETPHVVAERLHAALRYVDPEHLYACTDCGLMPRSRMAAKGKLRALAAGAAMVNSMR